MLIEVRNEFKVQNGRIINEDYKHDFHFFTTEYGGFVQFILPGIIHESVIIKTDNENVTLICKVDRDYVKLYQARSLHIVGKLPISVLSGVLTSEYSKGILSVEFISDTEN